MRENRRMNASPERGPRRRRDDIQQRRAEAERRQQRGSWLGGMFKLVILLLLVGAAYFAYDRYLKPVRDGRYAVMEKRMLTGDIIRTEYLSCNDKVYYDYHWKEPRFFLVCLGEKTRQNVVFEVSEADYRGYPLRTVLDAGKTNRWDRITPESSSGDGTAILETLQRLTGRILDVKPAIAVEGASSGT